MHKVCTRWKQQYKGKHQKEAECHETTNSVTVTAVVKPHILDQSNKEVTKVPRSWSGELDKGTIDSLRFQHDGVTRLASPPILFQINNIWHVHKNICWLFCCIILLPSTREVPHFLCFPSSKLCGKFMLAIILSIDRILILILINYLKKLNW